MVVIWPYVIPSLQSKQMFLFNKTSRLARGQPRLLRHGYRRCFTGLNRLLRHVHLSPPSSSEFRNEWSYTSISTILTLWHGAVATLPLTLSCKANAKVKPAKTGHGPHSSKFLCCCMYCLRCSMYFCVLLCIFVLFSVLFVLCRSLYCLCVYVYCTTATGWLPNCS